MSEFSGRGPSNTDVATPVKRKPSASLSEGGSGPLRLVKKATATISNPFRLVRNRARARAEATAHRLGTTASRWL